MPLNWNIKDCNMDEEFKKMNWAKIENMIYLTMIIDMGEIKANNLEQVEYRIRLYSRVTGSNYDDVIAFLPKMVGLKTNVITLSEKQYETKVKNILTREIREEIRRDRINKGVHN